MKEIRRKQELAIQFTVTGNNDIETNYYRSVDTDVIFSKLKHLLNDGIIFEGEIPDLIAPSEYEILGKYFLKLAYAKREER